MQFGDGSTNGIDSGNGMRKEYRSGQYIYQSMKDPVADFQQSAAFRNGVNQDLLGNKIKDKKMVFIEPNNKLEQDSWLDKIIQDITNLNKKEYADLLT